jgi:hypothetical protein
MNSSTELAISIRLYSSLLLAHSIHFSNVVSSIVECLTYNAIYILPITFLKTLLHLHPTFAHLTIDTDIDLSIRINHIECGNASMVRHVTEYLCYFLIYYFSI